MRLLDALRRDRDASRTLTSRWGDELRSSVENPATPIDSQNLLYAIEGPPSAAGVVVSETRALQSSAVYACVRLLSSAVASVPAHVYERMDRGRQRADSHPVEWLVAQQPNEIMSSVVARELMQLQLCMRGNAYALIERDRAGRVLALWPLSTSQVGVELLNGRLTYHTLIGGTSYPVPPSDMVHVRNFSYDGFHGLSPIQMARQAAGLAIAAEEYGARFFRNGANPGGVIEYPQKLDDAGYDRLSASWRAAHEGVANAHRVAILEEGAKFNALSISNQDSQFLETRKFQVAEIARIFGVPPHLIGDTDKSTSWGTGIEQQSIGFVQYVLMPWVRRWESELSAKLFTGDERGRLYIRFDLNGLMRGDVKTQSAAWAIGRQWGWYSANDVREQLEMPPVEGGDVYVSPLNMADAKTLTALDDEETKEGDAA